MTEPYYRDDLVTLYLGSCLEVTEWLEADVLITDPPYGLDSAISRFEDAPNKPPGWERSPEWDKDLAIRDAALDLWGLDGRPYAVFASPGKPEGALACREFPLVWDKGQVGLGDCGFPWGRGYELIYVNGPGWAGRRESPILRSFHATQAATKKGHPTPKPIGLMAALIRKAPDGLIADPFSGSGSTLRAAKDEGRTAVGVEINERYCEIAAKHLEQESLLGDLA